MTGHRNAALLAMILAAGLGGCAQLEQIYRPVDTVALKGPPPPPNPPACDAPDGKPGPATYDLAYLKDCTAEDTLIVFAFSGGGIRSAAFGYGALTAAHATTIPDAAGTHSMDRDIDVVSGVSGGSFTAAAFASHHDKLFPAAGAPDLYREKFLTHNFFADLASIYLAPWHWQWMLPEYGSQDEMAKIYAGIDFSGPHDKVFAATYGDLAKKGRPLLVVQATDYGNEQPFTFTQSDFDLICSDLNAYPVGNAVAASSAFPVLFSPIRLPNNHAGAKPGSYCARHRPGWVDEVLSSPEPVDLSRRYARARVADGYLPPSPNSPRKASDQIPRNVFLQDGGVTDNVALRGLFNTMVQSIGEDAGTPWQEKQRAAACQAGWGKVRRVLVVAVDGEAQPNNKVGGLPYLSDLFLILDVTSSALIDANGFETMLASKSMTEVMAKRLSGLQCDGSADAPEVVPYFTRISFEDLAAATPLAAEACDTTVKDGCTLGDLARSGTSLDFSDRQVQALMDAGRSAFQCNRQIQRFVGDIKGKLPAEQPLGCRLKPLAKPEGTQ